MATNEFKFSPHLVKSSSQPLLFAIAEVSESTKTSAWANVLDETALVLIVDKVQRVVGPGLPDLLEVFFQRHFATSFLNNFSDGLLVSLQIEVVHLAQGKPTFPRHLQSATSSSRIRQSGWHLPLKTRIRRNAERLEQLPPMPFLHRVRLQVRDDRVGFEVTPQHILNVFEGRVLPHPVWHVLGGI